MYNRYEQRKKIIKKKNPPFYHNFFFFFFFVFIHPMSERKAINKWYPPDYDPSQLPKKKPKQNGNQTIKIRMMAPYSMRCLKCDEYIGERRSFNARKEVTQEKYLNTKIIRFYINCPGCNNTITFKTDPKNAGYTPEGGAVRNFEKKKQPQTETEDDLLDRLQKEEEEDKKFKELQEKRKKNPFWKEQSTGMENLEKRLQEQQKQQVLNEQLEAIQSKVEVDKEKLEDMAREKLNQSKRKLDIPQTIKLKKKPKLLVNYSSDSD